MEVEGCEVIVDGRIVGFCFTGTCLPFGTGGCLPETNVEFNLPGTALVPGAPPSISPRFLKDMSCSNMHSECEKCTNDAR